MAGIARSQCARQGRSGQVIITDSTQRVWRRTVGARRRSQFSKLRKRDDRTKVFKRQTCVLFIKHHTLINLINLTTFNTFNESDFIPMWSNRRNDCNNVSDRTTKANWKQAWTFCTRWFGNTGENNQGFDRQLDAGENDEGNSTAASVCSNTISNTICFPKAKRVYWPEVLTVNREIHSKLDGEHF